MDGDNVWRMATQMAPTPTLYGKDAEEVLKQVSSRPSNQEINKLRSALAKKIEGVEKR